MKVVEAERAGASLLEGEVALRGNKGRQQGKDIFTSYPNCITDDARCFSLGDDILIAQVVTYFLPVGDDNEDL